MYAMRLRGAATLSTAALRVVGLLEEILHVVPFTYITEIGDEG